MFSWTESSAEDWLILLVVLHSIDLKVRAKLMESTTTSITIITIIVATFTTIIVNIMISLLMVTDDKSSHEA